MAREPTGEKLFDAAIRLMSERGYRETTVGDIEEAAGLTRRAGGFYRHFSSKEDVLVRAVERMANEMGASIRLDDVVALNAPRAELLVIAQALIRHAAAHRSLRVLIAREGSRLPALRAAAQDANANLAETDVLPWLENVLQRCGAWVADLRALALIIFGPVLLHILAVDRGDRAFGIGEDDFLAPWADHWAAWLERGARD